jgi:hypothetical protein
MPALSKRQALRACQKMVRRAMMAGPWPLYAARNNGFLAELLFTSEGPAFIRWLQWMQITHAKKRQYRRVATLFPLVDLKFRSCLSELLTYWATLSQVQTF